MSRADDVPGLVPGRGKVSNRPPPPRRPPTDPALSVLDVSGKVAILTFPDDPPADLGPMIESLAADMRAAGAVSVIVLTSGVTLTALSDEELASAGLRRTTDE